MLMLDSDISTSLVNPSALETATTITMRHNVKYECDPHVLPKSARYCDGTVCLESGPPVVC